MSENDVGPDGLNDRTDADERVVEIDDEDRDDPDADIDAGPLGGA